MLLVPPEGFTRDAPDAIAVHCARDEFLWYHERDSRKADCIGPAVDAEPGAAKTATRLERQAHVGRSKPL